MTWEQTPEQVVVVCPECSAIYTPDVAGVNSLLAERVRELEPPPDTVPVFLTPEDAAEARDIYIALAMRGRATRWQARIADAITSALKESGE